MLDRPSLMVSYTRSRPERNVQVLAYGNCHTFLVILRVLVSTLFVYSEFVVL